MSRPKLETASWIAGIVSAAAAVYVLIPSSGQPPGSVEPGPTTSAAISATPSAAASEAAATEPRSSIANALAAAKQLYYVSDRDAELERLSVLALKRREYSAALEAIEAVYYSSKKDELLDLLHCYSTYMGDAKTAKKTLGHVRGTSTKTAMLKRTAAFASMTPGEGPNDVPCRAL